MENIKDDKANKGNPIASMRFRWQTYTKDTDEPLESEWEQFKSAAIKQFDKFKKDDIIVKVFNEMNYTKKPVVITLQDAYNLI